MKSEQFWIGWFKGLTKEFLTSKFCKILMLPSNDRMDKDLTIAHMQGKFKLVTFFGEVGHCMMEDDPFQTAAAFNELLSKFKLPMNMDDVIELERVGIAFFDNKVKSYQK